MYPISLIQVNIINPYPLLKKHTINCSKNVQNYDFWPGKPGTCPTVRRSRGNPLYASLNMSKLVVADQENIDDVSYLHADTCTVQGHLKEFSHAHPPLPTRQNSTNFSTRTPVPSCIQPPLPRQTEFQEK